MGGLWLTDESVSDLGEFLARACQLLGKALTTTSVEAELSRTAFTLLHPGAQAFQRRVGPQDSAVLGGVAGQHHEAGRPAEKKYHEWEDRVGQSSRSGKPWGTRRPSG